MSGFSASWLALREPHDLAARDRGLVRALAHFLAARQRLAVLDMGSGTGSSLRALASHLPAPQAWRLVEHDPALIAAGMALLPRSGPAAWRYVEADLAEELETLLSGGCDLVTCSALLDLVSEPWMARLAGTVRALGVPLHAALTYDGRIALAPALPDDAWITELVNAHQRGAKGFGPALGPDATARLERLLQGSGRCLCAPSDWRLGPGDRAIQQALLEGWAGAAREMAPDKAPRIGSWLEERLALLRADRSRCTVGHRDLLWLPR